jgi:hypothetical protein
MIILILILVVFVALVVVILVIVMAFATSMIANAQFLKNLWEVLDSKLA